MQPLPPSKAANTPPQPQQQTQPAAVANDSARREGVDAAWFVRDNRVHIEDGSYVTGDHHLILHPKELAPDNQQRLFAKAIKHYALPQPSYAAYFPRNMVMEALADHLPISAQARLETLKDGARKLEDEVKTGIHPDVQAFRQRYEHPLEALTKRLLEEPQRDASTVEYVENAITAYLIVNEGLKRNGRDREAAAYIHRVRSGDQILADLSGRLGIYFDELTDAMKGGLNGLAKRLNVPPETVAEIRQVVRLAAQHQYGDNVIRNWEAGRQVPGMEGRNVEEKVAVGLLQRASASMQHWQQRIDPDKPLPADIEQAQRQVTALIRELPPVLQEALYYSGTELFFAHKLGLGHINPMMAHAKGAHWHIPFEHGGTDGMRQIYVSNFDSVKERRRIFHHEVSHLLFPKQMSRQERDDVNALVRSNVKRLKGLKEALDNWFETEDPARREAIEQQIDQQFRVGDIGLHQALARDGANPVSMETLHEAVVHGLQNLDPASAELAQAYAMPELRAAEVCFARIGDMQYGSYKDHQPMLGFIVPEMMVAYHDYFLPHVERQVAEFKQQQQELGPNLRYLGLPPRSALPQTQEETLAITRPPRKPEQRKEEREQETKAANDSEKPQTRVSAIAVQSLQRLDMPQPVVAQK